MAKITLFAQILQYLPKEKIRKIICKHDTDKHSKGCDTWTQLISMIVCQFADCVSLRDTANGMHSAMGNLNHLGVDKAPSKSMLGYQNKNRNSEAFKEIYYTALEHLGQQVVGGKAIHDLKKSVKLLDQGTHLALYGTIRLGFVYPYQRGCEAAYAAGFCDISS